MIRIIAFSITLKCCDLRPGLLRTIKLKINFDFTNHNKVKCPLFFRSVQVVTE